VDGLGQPVNVRLRHVGFRPGAEALLAVQVVGVARVEDDGNVRGHAGEPAAEIKAGAVREPLVQDVQVELLGLYEVERLAHAAGRSDLVVREPEQVREHEGSVFVVVNAQDATFCWLHLGGSLQH
jgi:hypothetical protein